MLNNVEDISLPVTGKMGGSSDVTFSKSEILVVRHVIHFFLLQIKY